MLRLSAIAFLSLLPISAGIGPAVDNAAADRIEEDWSVVIASPAPDVTGPQFTTSMKLDSSDTSPIMGFNLNYRDSPSFAAGGLQVKIRSGDRTLASDSEGTAQLQTKDESVTWTQRLSLAGGQVNFKVTAGKSTTWGDFGVADADLAVSTGSSAASLAGYSPDTSVQNSRPSFGSNLVTSMTLLRVRYYQGQTLLSTDNTPRTVNLAN